jgi:hypothetical protein
MAELDPVPISASRFLSPLFLLCVIFMSPIFLLSLAGFVHGFVQILSKDYAEPRHYIKFHMIITAYKIGEPN